VIWQIGFLPARFVSGVIPERRRRRDATGRICSQRVTPSRLRQVSRAWLSGSSQPGLAERSLKTEDLYAGVMVVDRPSLTAWLP
jgi:hypothetical protein